jgi:hypothetical protein
MQRGWDGRLTYIQPIAFSFKNVETSESAASCMLSQVIGGESYSLRSLFNELELMQTFLSSKIFEARE